MSNTGLPLVESYPITDVYADGLGRVEITGQNLRLVFFTTRPKDDGTLDREIVQRVVLPADALISAMNVLLAMPSIGMQVMAAIGKTVGRQEADLLQ
jgi:hypothetical protein